LYWSRVGRLQEVSEKFYTLTVAILIVLEQGWKVLQNRIMVIRSCVVAILIVLEQGWKASKRALYASIYRVAILIVLEQGWKGYREPERVASFPSQSSLYWSRVGRLSRMIMRVSGIVAILIVLEQGWKAKISNPIENMKIESQSSLYWSRVGRTGQSICPIMLFSSRNPHCTGAGLEEIRVFNAVKNFIPVAILIVLEQGWKMQRPVTVSS